MKRNNGHLNPVNTWIIFFLLTFIVGAIAIAVFVIMMQFTENMPLTYCITILTLIVVSAIATIIDSIRRKNDVYEPLNEILEATDKLSKNNFNVKLYSRGIKNDAFDIIKENINDMAYALSQNEILKTDFISNISHEIKTPLAIIKNYAELLNNTNNPEEIREYTLIINNATERLNNLILNILKLNRLEKHEIKIDKKEFDLSEKLRECLLAFENNPSFENIECDIDEITVVNDSSLIEIIFNNLISNAMKFADGKPIMIRLKKENSSILFQVEDHGIGMTKETGQHIFDRFYQGDTSHKKEGNGLGLSLVKRVIDILGAKISVSSELGKGSCFSVTLGE